MVLTPVSCCYVTPFNYGGKKAKDVGFTSRCHLSNIMPDSIFYDTMGWRITQFVCLFVCFLLLLFFGRGGNHCLPQQRRDGFSLITITPIGVGKP